MKIGYKAYKHNTQTNAMEEVIGEIIIPASTLYASIPDIISRELGLVGPFEIWLI